MSKGGSAQERCVEGVVRIRKEGGREVLGRYIYT